VTRRWQDFERGAADGQGSTASEKELIPMALGVLNNLSAIYAENNLNNTNNQPADGAAAVVVGVAHQLRSGRRGRPFAGERAGGELGGADAVETNATEGVGCCRWPMALCRR
jgi:hypothetical protein